MNKNNLEHILTMLIKNVENHYWEFVSNETSTCEIQLGEGILYECVLFRYDKYLHTFNIERTEEYDFIGPIFLNTPDGQKLRELFSLVLSTIKSPKYGEIDKASLANNSHWFIVANFQLVIPKEPLTYINL